MKSLMLAIAFSVLLFPLPVLAQSGASCPPKEEGGFQIKEEWKNHFPFDLVYPTGEAQTNISDTSECPVFTFFGLEREMCSIPMLTQIFKGVFIFKLLISFLKEG